jgi:hypothetical protein
MIPFIGVRTNLVAHVGQKFALCAAGHFRRFLRFAEPLGGFVFLRNVLDDTYVTARAIARGRNSSRDHIHAHNPS